MLEKAVSPGVWVTVGDIQAFSLAGVVVVVVVVVQVVVLVVVVVVVLETEPSVGTEVEVGEVGASEWTDAEEVASVNPLPPLASGLSLN